MKKIFDPAKIAALTRQFEQKAIARDNEALVSRLQKVAVAKTTITKTNDPKERRYVNKVAKDKMRMLRQSKQHLLNELNFENKLLLDLLKRSQSSIPSKKECGRHYQRHTTMRKTMSKVFTPKSVLKAKASRKKKRSKRKQQNDERRRMRRLQQHQQGSHGGMNPRDHPLYGTRDPISGQLPPIMQRAVQENLQRKEEEAAREQYFQQEHERLMGQGQGQQQQQQGQPLLPTMGNGSGHAGHADGGMDFSTIAENEQFDGDAKDEQEYLSTHALQSGSWRAVLPNPNVMSRGRDDGRSGGMMGRRNSRESLQSRGGTGGSMVSSAGIGGSGSGSGIGGAGHRQHRSGSVSTGGGTFDGGSSRGSLGYSSSANNTTAGSMRGSGLGPIEGAFEKRRMLMEPKEMNMSMDELGSARHTITCSAFRGVNDRLVYEISDPQTGIVRYYDIPAQLILNIGKQYPVLLETTQTKRVETLASLLDTNMNYFGNSDNVVAKMFWWQGKEG